MRCFVSLTTYTIAILFFVILTPEQSQCRIYKFTDENGVVHYSNVPNDHRYRPVGFSGRSTYGASGDEYQYDRHINEAARLYGIEPSLIKAVIKRESNFNPYARSKKGALGLMQLMPATARDMNVTDLFDPRENIFGGTRYLKWLAGVFSGDIELMLASYNAGPEKVRYINTIPDITETRNYVRIVMNYYNKYKTSL